MQYITLMAHQDGRALFSLSRFCILCHLKKKFSLICSNVPNFVGSLVGVFAVLFCLHSSIFGSWWNVQSILAKWAMQYFALMAHWMSDIDGPNERNFPDFYFGLLFVHFLLINWWEDKHRNKWYIFSGWMFNVPAAAYHWCS